MTLPTYVAPIGTLIVGAVGGYIVGQLNKPMIKSDARADFGYDPVQELAKYYNWITDEDDWRKGGENVAGLVIEMQQRFTAATVTLARKIKNSDTFVKKDIFRLKKLVGKTFKSGVAG